MNENYTLFDLASEIEGVSSVLSALANTIKNMPEEKAFSALDNLATHLDRIASDLTKYDETHN